MKYILMLWQKFKEWLSIGLERIKFGTIWSIAVINELPTSYIEKIEDTSTSFTVLGSTMTMEKLQHPLFTVVAFDAEDEDGVFIFDSVKIAELPIERLRSVTARFKSRRADIKEIASSVPLVFVDFPTVELREDQFYFEFMDENQDHFAAIEGKEDGLSAENYVIDDSQFSWRKHKYESSLVPRIGPETIYIKEEEYFVVFGGFVPTKLLPNECINDFCIEILGEREDLRIQKIIEESYYPINDLWKFHIKESRWELISPPKCLVQDADTREWEYDSSKPFGSLCYSFHCPSQKKIFFLTPEKMFSKKTELWEYEYLTNNFEKVAEIDLDHEHYSNRTPPLVDDSNNTVIFLANLLQKVLVVCLETFESIEIQLDPVISSNRLQYEWNMILTESRKILILIRSPVQKLQNEGDFIKFITSYGEVDWERIKRNKITPFLKKHRNTGI